MVGSGQRLSPNARRSVPAALWVCVTAVLWVVPSLNKGTGRRGWECPGWSLVKVKTEGWVSVQVGA